MIVLMHMFIACCIVYAYRVAGVLGGKGGGRKGRYQGKASHMENRQQAEELVRQKLLPQSQEAS